MTMLVKWRCSTCAARALSTIWRFGSTTSGETWQYPTFGSPGFKLKPGNRVKGTRTLEFLPFSVTITILCNNNIDLWCYICTFLFWSDEFYGKVWFVNRIYEPYWSGRGLLSKVFVLICLSYRLRWYYVLW